MLPDLDFFVVKCVRSLCLHKLYSCFAECRQCRHSRWSKFTLLQTEAHSFCGISFYYSADTLPDFALTRTTKEWCFSLFPLASPDAQKTTKKQRAELLKNLAGAIVPKRLLVEAKSQQTNTNCFFFICVSSLSCYGYDCWEMVCSGTHDNLKKKTICVQVHVFLLVFYCLVPACLSMYNCKQFCQGQLTWQIQGSWSWHLIP